MPLTILTDLEVKVLLHSLTKNDILAIQQSLADALHHYSTAEAEEHNPCGATYQPKRTHMARKDGGTTLFMPASSTDGMGVKIVTLAEKSDKSVGPATPAQRVGSFSSAGDHVSTPTSGSSIKDSSSTSDTASVSTGMSSLSMGSGSSGSWTPFKLPPDLTQEMKNCKMKTHTTSPVGSLTILNSDGSVRGLLNAGEITAFRTALAATMLFKKRKDVHDVAIFGAGKQAYWHARLALILRGSEVHHLNFINRSFDRVTDLLFDLHKISWPVPVPSHPKTTIVTTSHHTYESLLKSTVRASSVIFCTTPSTSPLFPAEILTNTEGRKKGRYISAIGSYKPHMIEVHTDIIKQAVAPHHHKHHHKHANEGGAIVVDSVDACLAEAGEIIQAGLTGNEIVELGELVMLKRDAERRRNESNTSLDSEGVELQSKAKSGKGSKDDDGGLGDWLRKGNVIYKSVGLGLMDVVVGQELCNIADRLRIGTRIENF